MPYQVLLATDDRFRPGMLRGLLEPLQIDVIHIDMWLPRPRIEGPELNAAHRVRKAVELFLRAVIDHSVGFYIDAIKNFPGTRAKFILEAIGVEGILKLVEGKARGCEYHHCLAYMDPIMPEPVLFSSTFAGSLATKPCGPSEGDKRSELGSIFIPHGQTKTLNEMDSKEFQNWRKETENFSFCASFAEWLKGHRPA